MTVAELSERLGGRCEGDGARQVVSVATLEQAGPDALSWLARPELVPRLAETRAAAVLVPVDCAAPPRQTVVRVADVEIAMCEAVRLLGPHAERVAAGIHPTAVLGEGVECDGVAVGACVCIGPRARIGRGTEVHAGVYVGADAVVGRDCTLWPGVVIRERVRIGDRVVVHANAVIGADGFGYLQRDGRHVKIPHAGTVVIEDDVEIGAGTTIDRGKTGATRIGRGTKVDNLVQIGHNCDIGEDCVIVAQCGISGSTTLGRHVMLAGQVGLIDHLRIGDRVMVGAKAGVLGDLPDDSVVLGSPSTHKGEFLRQQAALRRLPDALQKLRDLMKRVERLEASTDNPA